MKQTGVIILSPPWPRSGTSNIVAAQIAAYRENNIEVLLLLEPMGPWNSKYALSWRNTIEGMPYSDEIPVTYPSTPLDLFKQLGCRIYGRCDDAITEVANYAASGELPRSVYDFMRRHTLGHIRVNHVFGMKLAKQLQFLVDADDNRTPPIVLDTHDIQSDTFAISQRRNIFSNRIDPKSKMLDGELELAQNADILIHISISDYNFFSSALPDRRHYYVPPTLNPLTEKQLVLDRNAACPADCDFVFFGNNHVGNLMSIKWLLLDVFPHFTGSRPRIKIIGTLKSLFKKRERELFRRHADLFTGEVPSIFSAYRGAKAVLAHSSVGTGASIKLIEALCAGKPTITSTTGMRGAPSLTASSDLIVTDQASDFADAMIAIASKSKMPSVKNASAYDNSFSNFTYKTALDSILQ